MAFEYGSTDLEISNPYSLEGKIRIVGGLLTAGLGLLSLLNVPGAVTDAGRASGLLQLSIALLLSLGGLIEAGRGAIQVFRFYVGRNAPADLASKQQGDAPNTPGQPASTYSAEQLAEMLVGRKNLTYRAPSGWLRHLGHSVFPRLLILPPVYRALAEHLLRLSAIVIAVFAGYWLLWFLGFSGLIDAAGFLASAQARFLLVGALTALLLSLRVRQPLSAPLEPARSSRMSILIPLVSLPALGFAALASPPAIPEPAFLSTSLLVTVLILLGVTVGLFGRLLRTRATIAGHPATEVSEFRGEWQESVHPQSLFTHLDSIIMNRRRHKELPNRVYSRLESALLEEGSDNKGAFDGRIIQEVQPVHLPMRHGKDYDRLKAAASAVGVLLVLVAACLVYLLPRNLPDSAVAVVLYAIVFFAFGRTILDVVHGFWCEVQFDSTVVLFECSGTYSESKVSVGKAIHDTASSENYVVRARLTPLLIVAQAVTSTFVGRGSKCFDNPRYLLEFDRAPGEMESILGEFREFAQGLSHIAPIRSEEDAGTASSLVGLNRRAFADRRLAAGRARTEKRLGPSELEESEPVDDQH